MKRFLVCLLTLLMVSPLLYAQGSGKYKHDGFFMRFLVGGSYSTMKLDGMGTEYELSGMAGDFRFQIGTEIGENLNVFGEVGGSTITNPEMKVAGQTYDTEDLKASALGIGGGLTYYFMPSNMYVTGSVLLSQARMEFKSGTTTSEAESDFGFGMYAGVGKEWWVGDDWGIGAAVFVAYSSVPDKDNSDIKINTLTFGVAFSATMQ